MGIHLRARNISYTTYYGLAATLNRTIPPMRGMRLQKQWNNIPIIQIYSETSRDPKSLRPLWGFTWFFGIWLGQFGISFQVICSFFPFSLFLILFVSDHAILNPIQQKPSFSVNSSSRPFQPQPPNRGTEKTLWIPLNWRPFLPSPCLVISQVFKEKESQP